MRGRNERRTERNERKEAAAQAWYESITPRSITNDIINADGSLAATGLLLNDLKTQAIVQAQTANLKATLLVVQRLDRIIELLEERSPGAPAPPVD